MTIDELLGQIVREAERLLGTPFEGTPDQSQWLATHLGLDPADDLKWRYLIDPEADEKLDPEHPEDERAIEFLADDEAVERFLTTLLERYRGANGAATRDPGPRARPAPPAHSEAFVRVRDRLLALEDDADRAALARLFGAIAGPEADPSPGLVGLLRSIATLDDADVVKLARWCRTYVTRSGHVPKAPGPRPA